LKPLELLYDTTEPTSSSKKPGSNVNPDKNVGQFCIKLLPLDMDIDKVFESSLDVQSDKKVRQLIIDSSIFSRTVHNENDMNNYLDRVVLRQFFDRVKEVHTGGDMEIPYFVINKPDFQVLCHEKLCFIEMKKDEFFNLENSSNYLNLFSFKFESNLLFI
jgi:hypothetical protein